MNTSLDSWRTTRRSDAPRTNTVFVGTLVIAALLTAAVWFLMSSGYWDIKQTNIEGLKDISRGEVESELTRALEDRAWRPWHSNNLFFLDKEHLRQGLKDRLFVDDVEIEKNYPDILRLIIHERQRSIVLVSHDEYTTVDASGIVTGSAEGDILNFSKNAVAAKVFLDELHQPVVVMQTEEPASPGFQIARPEQVRQWLTVTRLLVLGGVQIRFMKIETPESHLARFVANRGYDIYVDLYQPIEPQMKTYLEYIKTQPKLDNVEHIDVRIPGKIFVQ